MTDAGPVTGSAVSIDQQIILGDLNGALECWDRARKEYSCTRVVLVHKNQIRMRVEFALRYHAATFVRGAEAVKETLDAFLARAKVNNRD